MLYPTELLARVEKLIACRGRAVKNFVGIGGRFGLALCCRLPGLRANDGMREYIVAVHDFFMELA